MKRFFISGRALGTGFLLLFFIGALVLSTPLTATAAGGDNLVNASSGDSYSNSVDDGKMENEYGSDMHSDSDSNLGDDDNSDFDDDAHRDSNDDGDSDGHDSDGDHDSSGHDSGGGNDD